MIMISRHFVNRTMHPLLGSAAPSQTREGDVCHTSGRCCCAYDMHSMRWEMAQEHSFFFPVPDVVHSGINQGIDHSTSWRGQRTDAARTCMHPSVRACVTTVIVVIGLVLRCPAHQPERIWVAPCSCLTVRISSSSSEALIGVNTRRGRLN